MAQLLLLTPDPDAGDAVLPALSLLSHKVRAVSPERLADLPSADLVLLDARADLAGARALCKVLARLAPGPVLLVVGEGGAVTLAGDWGFSDFVLAGVGPAELDARIRVATSRPGHREVISAGSLEIDEGAYTARIGGRALDLTWTEFELLRFLVQHPGRVFSRDQLLADVWGHDYYGGSRTVDVHVRRLRAKLGPEHEQVIGTVRGVGYRFAGR